MAFKTYAQLAVATDVQDGDLLASFRGTGPLKSVTALISKGYFSQGLGGTSGHFFGFLDGANTYSATQTISVNTATTAADYLILKPTDYGTGKPGLFFSKEAAALNWQVQLYDGATVAGQLDAKLTLLNLTGALTLSGALTIGAGLIMTGSSRQNLAAVPVLDIDTTAAEWFTKSISTNSTFTISGATSGKVAGFMLELTISSAAAPTFTGVRWEFGTQPIFPNGISLIGFVYDGSVWTAAPFAVNVS